MKKRILSFLMACFMVASTFIISKPLVHVHAVEQAGTFTKDSLPDVLYPVDDSDDGLDAKGNLAVSGNWSARVYKSMTDRTALSPNMKSLSLNTDTRWTFSVSSRTFGSFDSATGSDAKVCVNPDVGAVPVIVFTAPEDGVYYFNESVLHNVFEVSGLPIGVNFMVFKGDYAYDNLFSAGPDAVEGNLTGYVALKAGEELLFAAERAFYSISINTTSNDGTLSGAYINDIVVVKSAELPDEYADEVYSADFYENGLSTGAITEGQFTLSSYSFMRNEPVYFTDAPIFTESNNRYSYESAGTQYWMGRSDITYGTVTYNGAAVVFKAPKAGYYSLSIDANQSYVDKSGNIFWYAKIVKASGTTIGMSQSYVATSHKTPANFLTAGTAFLEEGEEVYFLIRYSNTKGHFAGFRSVSAVYLGETTVPDNGDSTYELPMDWNSTGTFDNNWELAVQGPWRLTTLSDPADNSTMRIDGPDVKLELTSTSGSLNDKAPQSYLESRHNRGLASGSIEDGLYPDASTWTQWKIYINHRYDGSIWPISFGNNATYMDVNPSKNVHSAVVFTAPEDGTYSYSELVSLSVFEKGGVPVVINATVRKNGAIIDVVTLTAEDPTENLSGIVSLKQDEMLTFVFTLASNVTFANTDEKPIQLGETVVTKIGDYAEEEAVTETNYEFPMDFNSLENSYFALKAIDPKTGNYVDVTWIDENFINYEGKPATDPDAYEWEVIVPGKKPVFYLESDGDFIYRGERTYVPVIEFTAPADGVYSFDVEAYKQYGDEIAKNLLRREVLSLVKGNEFETYEITELATNGVAGKNVLATYKATKSNDTFTLSATVELKAGETVSFIRSYAADATTDGATPGVLKHFEVTAYNVTCPHDWTDANGVCACGYACTHEGGTANVYVDNNDGTHTVKYSCCGAAVETVNCVFTNGVCDKCEAKCAHKGGTATCTTKAVCTECGMSYGELDPNNHASAEFTYENLGNGTHKKYNACCSALVGTENCTYIDHVCDYCGYFNKPAAANDTLDSVVEKWLAGTDIGVTPDSFDKTVLDGHTVTEPAPDAIKGFEYKLFNLDFDADGNIFIRHHFFIEAGTTVTVNDNEELVKVAGNYYYYDITPELGSYDDAATIVANDGTNSVTIEVSLYSYIKVALEDDSGKLTEKEANFLKVLCQLNEMAK